MPGFWSGKRILMTGHTGFKGSWLSLMLRQLDAQVTGFALAPPTQPSMYELAGIAQDVVSDIRGDVADLKALTQAMAGARPEIIFHLAAQSLVKTGYADPVKTYLTNVMGTVNLLEAARHQPSVRVIVVVTTDKCYENREWVWGYRESDVLGGRDPYSNSKACTEFVTSAFRSSYFEDRGIALVSVRAGNVLGGGDFAADRILPDAVRAFLAGRELQVRSPNAVRPWQHVLDPLHGYLLLAERAFSLEAGVTPSWNFGPSPDSELTVEALIAAFVKQWGDGARWCCDRSVHPHETQILRLDTAQARTDLGWTPLLGFDETIKWTADWYKAMRDGQAPREFTSSQVRTYISRCSGLMPSFHVFKGKPNEAKRIA